MLMHVRCQIGNNVEPIIVRIRFSLRENRKKKRVLIACDSDEYIKLLDRHAKCTRNDLLSLGCPLYRLECSVGLDVRRLDGSIVLQSFSLEDIKKMHG